VRGNSTFGFDPVRELAIALRGEFHDGAAQAMTVIDEIVAAQDVRRRRALLAALTQRMREIGNERPRRVGMLQIVLNVRMRGIQAAIGTQAIALLRDRRRDQLRRWVDQALEHGPRRFARNEQFLDRTDDPIRGLLVQDRDRVEPVLRRERIAHARALERQPADRPAWIRMQQRIDVRRLVGAMEGAGTEMHDAERRAATVVAGHGRAGFDRVQVRFVEAQIHGRGLQK